MANRKKSDIALPNRVDLRYKCVKGFWGRRKIVPTSIKDQIRIKKEILKAYPDSDFYDDLEEDNSVDAGNKKYVVSSRKKPIDLRYKYKLNLFGIRITKRTSPSEQRRMKKAFLQVFPDCLFYDNLADQNSVPYARDNYNDWNGDPFGHYSVGSIFGSDCYCDSHDSHNDCDGDCDCAGDED